MLAKLFSYPLTATVAKTFPGGRFLRLLTADDNVDVELFDESSQSLGLVSGVKGGFAIHVDDFAEKIGRRVATFGKVEITSATNQTVEVVVARVRVDYDRLTGSVTAQVAAGTTATQSSATVGAASGALLAANANRKRAWIRNTHATDRIHFCDDGTAALTSHPYIEPGEEIAFESQDGLNAIRGGATDITALIREERA